MSISGTPCDELWNALEVKLGVPVVAPGEQSGRRVQVERSRGVGVRPVHHGEPYRVLLGLQAHRWHVTCFDGNDASACALVAQAWAHLDLLVGPPQGGDTAGRLGYKIDDGDGVVGGDGSGSMTAADFYITTYTKVPRSVSQPMDITATPLGVIATGAPLADGRIDAP